MKPRVIGFLIHTRCNAACRHCCFESNPTRTVGMSEEDALFFAHQVTSVKGLRGIPITGGEPFLQYNLLQKVLRILSESGLKARIVSNCYWATSPERARRKLEPLHNNGLRELSVSYDAVHEEFVPKERVGYAVHAALKLSMKVVIGTVIINGDLNAHIAQIREELSLPESENLFIMPGYIVPNGHAMKSFSPFDFALVDGDKPEGARLQMPCPHVVREPVITPAGKLAACCSPSTATRSSFHHSFVVGSLHQHPLAYLLNELENNVMFNMIMIDGPWKLYELVRQQDPTAIPRKEFVNICDLCMNVVSNTKAQKILQEQLPEYALPTFATKVALEAYTGGDIDDYLGQRVGVISLRPHK